MKTVFGSALIASAAIATPTAIFHGMGDACIYPGMRHFTKEIKEQTGDYAACIEVGNGSLTSLFDNFENQAEMACAKLQADKNFQGAEINVMGLSQGALIARSIVESCPLQGKVRQWASIGGPNMGVSDVPHCFNGFFCELVNSVARSLVYMGIVQNHFGPAGYFRDPHHMNQYLNDSVFLASLNNERGDSNTLTSQKTNFENLNGALLVMFEQDSMVYPKESEWFQQLEASDMKTVQPLEDSDFYKNDLIGLKTLNEAGKVQFESFPGDHLQFTEEDIANVIVPFLMQ